MQKGRKPVRASKMLLSLLMKSEDLTNHQAVRCYRGMGQLFAGIALFPFFR